MSYYYDLFFIFSLIFIVIKTDALVFVYFLEYLPLFLDSMDEESK